MLVRESGSYVPTARPEEFIAVRWFFAAVFIAVAASLSVPFLLGGDYYLSIFTDDLFYYLKIAENVVAGKGTTFNGLVSTNGYQPLWQLFIVGLQLLANALQINVIFLLTLSIFFFFVLYARLLDITIREKYSTAYFLLMALNLIFYLQSALSGMEIIVLMPLIIVYFNEFRKVQNEWNYYRIGFYASLVILARLDAIFLIFIHLMYLLINKKIRIGDLVKVSVGAILFPIYLVGNYFFYGTLMPISGVIKGVSEFRLILHPATFVSLFQYGIETTLLNAGIIVTWLCIGPRIILKKIKVEGELEHILWAVCLFMPLFFIITSMRSDWYLWRWYFYPLYVFFIYASVYVGRLKKVNLVQIPIGFMAIFSSVVVMALCSVIALKLSHKNDRHIEALEIRQFATEHPGVYAMGDRAGLPAYITDVPFVQLEGLVMDKQYLENLKQVPSMDALLKIYDVSYYISSDAKDFDSNGCFRVKEPSQSRGFSVQLKSKICWPIAKTLKSPKDGANIYIFKRPDV